jgi:meiotically up-regulated gene 157 (Mug157) protein
MFIGCNNATETTTAVDNSPYTLENGGFETGDLTGFEVLSGNAFSFRDISDEESINEELSYNKDGQYFYKSRFEERTGMMKSDNFIIGGNGHISIRIGAGYNVALTYVSVVRASDDVEIFRFGNHEFDQSGYLSNPESLEFEVLNKYYADLSFYLGEEVYLKFVDDSLANYGYLLVDDIVTFYQDESYLVDAVEAVDIKPQFVDAAGTPNQLYNADFSVGSLNGWTLIGEDDSFKTSHIDENYRLSNRVNESSVGVLRSSAFRVNGEGLISFRMGGTKHQESTYLSIKKVGTNEEVFRTFSNRWKESDEEATHLYFIDLNDHYDERLYIELVDNSRTDWGLITFEDLTTHYQELPMVYDEIALNILDDIKIDLTYTEMRNYVDGLIDSITDETERITFEKNFYATIDGIENFKGSWPSVIDINPDGTVFVSTGDIDAMWLRDSSAQVLPYLQFMDIDEDVQILVRGLLKKQFELIRRDPYANAFNRDGSVFERKFEIDSLCYPIWLAYEYYERTEDGSIFDKFFEMTVIKILETFENEMSHTGEFYQIPHQVDRDADVDQVNTDSGLIWSGYRPSDDVTYYKFFIPGNMFAVATLEKLSEIYQTLNLDEEIETKTLNMANDLRAAIETYGVYEHPVYGKIYAFEVDGMTSDASSSNGKLLMDVANIPSLLSAPWLGYCDKDDETYLNTRAFALSFDNPYYYEGEYAKGIGDPHDMVGSNNNPHPDVPVPWHMAIAMQALTSMDIEETRECVDYMVQTTGGTYVMHEAFNANNPGDYSRDYFTWPCALFAEVYLTQILNVNR